LGLNDLRCLRLALTLAVDAGDFECAEAVLGVLKVLR